MNRVRIVVNKIIREARKQRVSSVDFLRHYVIAFILIAFALALWHDVANAELWMISGGWSHHFDADNHNETHNALGAQYKTESYIAAGAVLLNGDSHGENAGYIGAGLEVNNFQLLLAAVQHSSLHDGRTTVLLLPSYTLEYEHIGFNFYAGPVDGGAVAAELKFRLR